MTKNVTRTEGGRAGCNDQGRNPNRGREGRVRVLTLAQGVHLRSTGWKEALYFSTLRTGISRL